MSISRDENRNVAKVPPIRIESCKGSRVGNTDGNDYIDYAGSRGASILGHKDPKVHLAVADG
ncbi:hypothetical protein CDL15_Pgr009261 [Punica granatum]|nr:hypothetical protein CDL15_Pgr009261 [Punica granatum]